MRAAKDKVLPELGIELGIPGSRLSTLSTELLYHPMRPEQSEMTMQLS